MKKLLLISILFLSLTIAHGQLNPIKNLQLSHVYQNPLNCYLLSWSQPNASTTDTLVGYNIYRKNTFYVFTTNTTIGYNPCQGFPDTTYEGFMSFNPYAFFTHVTAVYDKSHIESAYNDSAYWYGLAIGIKENINYSEFKISPNPFSSSTTLRSDNFFHNATLRVYNCFGQAVKEIKNISRNEFILYRDNLPSGLYFIRLTTPSPVLGEGGGEVYTSKLIITDN